MPKRMAIVVHLVIAFGVSTSVLAVDAIQRVDLTYGASDGTFRVDSGAVPLRLLHINSDVEFFIGPQPAGFDAIFHNYRPRVIGTRLGANEFSHLSFPPGSVAIGLADADLAASLEVDARTGVLKADVWCLNGEYCHWELAAGDFNNDFRTDAVDIDELTTAIRFAVDPLPNELNGYDLDFSGSLTVADREIWVSSIRKTYFGDANLDGTFDASDLIAVFQAGEYLDDVVGNSTWRTGDWNGDGEFSPTDFITAFNDGGYGQGPRAAILAVPEPTPQRWLGACLLVAALRRRLAAAIRFC